MNLTPARIAEEAIGMFLECLDHNEGDIGDDDDVAFATAQAIAETEGYEVILPHEIQRLQAASDLLAVCKAIVCEDDIAQGYGGIYAHLSKLREMAKVAISKAESISAENAAPCDADLPL